MATSLKIDETLKQRVQSVADSRRRSAHSVMLEAIRQYVDAAEARSSFESEADASWVAYQETGLHLTGAEVSDWMAGWGTDAETGAPECHE
jgi:predicted transcriptional regulator